MSWSTVAFAALSLVGTVLFALGIWVLLADPPQVEPSSSWGLGIGLGAIVGGVALVTVAMGTL